MTKKLPSFKVDMDKTLNHLRWLWLVVALIVAQLGEYIQPARVDLEITYLILGLGVAYNLLVLAILYIGWFPDWMAVVIAILDISLALALFWFTGGYDSMMLPVLLFVVVTVGLRFSPEAGLLAATPLGLAYAVSLILSRATSIENFIIVSGKVISLFLVGGVVGYLGHRQLRTKTAQMEEELKQLRVENDRAKVLYEMANTLSSTLNYQKVLKAMIELAQIALSEADDDQQDYYSAVSMVLLFENEGPLGKLKLVSGRNIPRTDENRKVAAQEGILAQVIYKAEAVISNEVQRDPVLKQFSALSKSQSVLIAPLRAGFDLYGVVLFANPKPNFYNENHASLLSTFCNQATIAMQNAQLYADLEREQKKLLEKEAQARRELARNLHDGPTQAVAAVAMRLNFVQMLLSREKNIPKALEELAKIEEIAQHTTKEIRNMLFTLRPIVLETQGLEAALRQYADRLSDLDNLNISVDINGYQNQLATEAEGVLFAIIEEAVGNAKKYAKSSKIQITIEVADDYLTAQVSDEGGGFDVAKVKGSYDQRGSLGLVNMDERAKMLGGRCDIESVVGVGTTVTATIPLNRQS